MGKCDSSVACIASVIIYHFISDRKSKYEINALMWKPVTIIFEHKI